MSLASSQYDVKLNGSGFILIEESYRKKAQQPFNARFSSGDYSFGDLSYWQFLAEENWTSQEQEIFINKALYRQSAGWDLRYGKPYQARGVETLALNVALPASHSAAAVSLLDNFEGTIAPDPSIWNAMSSPPTNFEAQSVRLLSSSHRAYSGQHIEGGSFGITPARYAGSTYTDGGNTLTNKPILRSDTALQTTGTWQFVLYTTTSGLNVKHASIALLGNASGGYVLEISGADMVTWKLIKTSSDLSTGILDTTNDTVVATFVATGGSATAVTVKVTRSSIGAWEVFENGGSLGTVTDNTYSSAKYIGFSTYVKYDSGGVFQDATTVDDFYVPGTTVNNSSSIGKFIQYLNSLYLCYQTDDYADFTFTTIKAASTPSNIPQITHVNVQDLAVWSRDGNPTDGQASPAATNRNTFLIAVKGSVMKVYNLLTLVTTQDLSATHSTSFALGIYATAILPINSKTILIAGTTAENSGIPAVQVLTFTANTWVATTSQVLTLEGGVSGSMISSAAIDSSGTIYLATCDMSGQLGSMPSRVYTIVAADVISTYPTISKVASFSDFTIRGIVSVAGTIYLLGAYIDGDNVYHGIQKYPSTQVYKSLNARSYSSGTAVQFNYGIAGFWPDLDHVLVLGETDQSIWNPILQVDVAGNVREVASFKTSQFGYSAPVVVAIAEWEGQFYLLNHKDGTIQRTTRTRGGLSDYSYGELQLSDMGGNTPLINKSLYSVLIELSSALASSQTLTIKVNGTTVGTMTQADGTAKEITVSSAIVASVFTPKVQLTSGQTWTGYIQRIALKYVPVQFKKRAWGMGLRTTKSLKLSDGTRETNTPVQLAASIEAAWASQIPIPFIDVDGVTYSVLVTDYDQRRPLLQRKGGTNLEAFYFVELLEV